MSTQRFRIRDVARPKSAARDLVDEWARRALANIEARRWASGAVRPGLRCQVTPALLALGLLAGAGHGLAGALFALFALVSTLIVQEAPRALLARALGRSAHVVLSTAGGRTEHSGPAFQGLAARAFVSVGSLANLALGGALFAARHQAGALRTLALCHLAMGAAQLLPLIPFRVGVAFARTMSPGARLLHATISISLLTTACIFLVAARSSLPPALISVLLVVASFGALRDAHDEHADSLAGLPALAKRAAAALRDGRPTDAAEQARRALPRARSLAVRDQLWTTLAWAGIANRDPFLTHAALQQLRPRALDVHLLAAYLDACNRFDDAIELIENARARGHLEPETDKLMIDVLIRRGQRARAWSFACSESARLSPDEKKMVQAALFA